MLNKKDLIHYIKYGLIGIVNTLIGYACIFTFMYVGVSPIQSNFLGYLIGMVVSYFLNRKYNFKSNQKIRKEMPLFFIIVAGCYILNLFVLKYALDVLYLNKYLAQAIAGVAYTLLSVFLLKFLVFKN